MGRERSGGIGGEIKKSNRVYVECGSDSNPRRAGGGGGGGGRGIGRRRRRRRKGEAGELLSEKNGGVREMGVAGEGEVVLNGRER